MQAGGKGEAMEKQLEELENETWTKATAGKITLKAEIESFCQALFEEAHSDDLVSSSFLFGKTSLRLISIHFRFIPSRNPC